jgi:hypothetical protein
MSYASRLGRARINSRNPQAAAVCDRCGFVYNHVNLRWQFDWRGASLMNTRMLVCNTCYDQPQEQLRAIVVSPDPVPILNPRVQDYVAAGTNYRTTSGQNTVDPTTGLPVPGTTVRTTQANDTRVTQQTGEPPGGLNRAPGTNPAVPNSANIGLPYNNTSVPLTGPLPPNTTYDIEWVNVSGFSYLGDDVYWINSYGQLAYWSATEIQP